MVQLSPPSWNWLHYARMQDFSRAKSKMLVPEAQGQFSVCTRWVQHQSGSGEADEFTLWYTHHLPQGFTAGLSRVLYRVSPSLRAPRRGLFLRQTLPITLEKSYSLEKEGGLGGGVYWPFTSLTAFSTELSPRRRLLSLGFCHHGLHVHGTQSLSHLWERRHTGENTLRMGCYCYRTPALKTKPFPHLCQPNPDRWHWLPLASCTVTQSARSIPTRRLSAAALHFRAYLPPGIFLNFLILASTGDTCWDNHLASTHWDLI